MKRSRKPPRRVYINMSVLPAFLWIANDGTWHYRKRFKTHAELEKWIAKWGYVMVAPCTWERT
jgi:hypothetical protein